MTESFKSAVTITLTILLGVGLQVVFALSEMSDDPNKAAVEFTKAYFSNDSAMKNRLCSDILEKTEGDPVAAYINQNIQKASDRGFSMCYTADRVKHINTTTISMDQDSAVLEIEATLKNSLRSFFTGEKAQEVHETLLMVKENGQWKVCGNPFMIAGEDYVVASVVEEDKAVEEEAAEVSDEAEDPEEDNES